jgi:hypothetical protein
MDQKFHYTMKASESGEPTIEQQEIGNVSISYNPDDQKFYVQDSDHAVYASGKSWRNIPSRANELLQRQRRAAATGDTVDPIKKITCSCCGKTTNEAQAIEEGKWIPYYFDEATQTEKGPTCDACVTALNIELDPETTEHIRKAPATAQEEN